MMKKSWLFTIAIVVGLLIAACVLYVNTPISCSRLVDKRLHEGINNNQDTIRNWIADTYLFGELSLDTTSNAYAEWFSWYSLTNRYSTADNNKFQTLYQEWLYKDVLVKDVIRCLGAPSAYSGSQHTAADVLDFHFSLWYPELGYVFLDRRSAKSIPLYISPESQLFLVGVYESDVLSTVIEKAYPAGHWGKSFIFDTDASLKQWPADFQKIDIEPSGYFNQK